MAVDVNGEAGQPGLLQLFQYFRCKRQRIGQDDRLHLQLGDVRHHFHDVRVDERFAAGDGHIVRVAPLLEEKNLFLDLFERLVAGDFLPVAALAVEIADVGEFQPGNGIVIHRPGESV